jgi:hypothetical protein
MEMAHTPELVDAIRGMLAAYEDYVPLGFRRVKAASQQRS